jgi:hypothetical protein
LIAAAVAIGALFAVGVGACVKAINDFDLGIGYTGPTLAPLPAPQCDALRAVRDQGRVAYDDVMGTTPPRQWPKARQQIDDHLVEYGFVLRAARAEVPLEFQPEFDEVARAVDEGRVVLSQATSAADYRTQVVGRVIDGFAELSAVEDRLGNACGERFTFWPSEMRLPASSSTGAVPSRPSGGEDDPATDSGNPPR